MKKILLITENLGSGGAERQICGLADFLTGKGFPCRLITYYENQFYEQYLKEHKVDYEFVPTLMNKKTRVFKLVQYLYKYKPDVVISYLPSVNITTCLARIFYRCKLIVSDRNNNTGISRNDKILYNMYRMADFVVPNSNCQGEFIRKNFPFLKNKVKPIINFVDLEKFVPAERKVKNEISRIITAARVTNQKNVLTYLDAVKIVKDNGINVHFDWFGSKIYNAAYYNQVTEKIQRLKIEDYITFHDESKDIISEYQKSEIFCLPSLFEGYPNVLVEAMSCGLPVICSDVYENPYIVKDCINGLLFNPTDPNMIANCIEKMLNFTDAKLKAIGAANRASCLEKNRSDIFTDNYINLIENG